jgi:8-oxo-dGTP pyrophosphatase MutT (NUDIX family)
MAASTVEPAPGGSSTESSTPVLAGDGGRLPSDWQARLRARLLAAPDHSIEADEGEQAGRLPAQPGAASAALQSIAADAPEAMAQGLRAAAALVPIVLRPDGPTVLLTVRSRQLRRHAGQVSFPGGALESGDQDAAAAAVRETGEEVGILPAFIEPIGFLPDHVVGSGFRLTPVVALLRPGFTVTPERSEVEEVFELPLAFALARANYRLRRHSVRGTEREFWELCYGARMIWGATARVLVSLQQILSGAGA